MEGCLVEVDVAVGRCLLMLLGVLERSRSCECCEWSSETSMVGGDGLDTFGVAGVAGVGVSDGAGCVLLGVLLEVFVELSGNG